MSIPLVQNNEKDSINTSIIAIKRNIERINMLLGLVDSGSPDLSGLATKQELEDAVNSLQPVDEVTVGNMQSVSSDAVAKVVYNVLTEFLYLNNSPYWVRFLPPYVMFERTGIAGKHLRFEFGVYRYNSSFDIQVCWGTQDAVIQEATGVGRIGFASYNQNSSYSSIQNDCKFFVLDMTIPSSSNVLGIKSNCAMFIRNFSIT